MSEPPFTLIDPDGRWVGPADPPADVELFRRLQAEMLAIQALDERLTILVKTGRSSIMTSAAGHEAAHVGIAAAVRRGVDWVFPYYRDQGLLLSLGVDPRLLFGQMLATVADSSKGRQTPTHIGCRALRIFNMSSPVGSHLPVAVGAAMALRRQEPGAAVVCTFGDGATSTGDFHGALTLAAVLAAPIVFVCENNRYAISVPVEAQSPSETIAAKAAGYGMPGHRVDGLDVLAVRDAVAQALDRARSGHGPALLELDLYRFEPHSSSDDDSRYRTRDEIDRHRPRDAVGRLRRFLESRQLVPAGWEADTVREIKTRLAAALAEADGAGAIPPQWMFDDVFADLPWHLAEQRDRLANELD
jgi:2-oxoisovalerate dehydrogenase E1 component alpha subunit